MKHIEIVVKENNPQVWLTFTSNEGVSASICLNNLANDRADGIIKSAMQKAIAEYLTAEIK